MRKTKAIEKFIDASDQWLATLESLNDQSLALKPSEKQWCIAELYDHIVKVARTYQIPNFLKCLATGTHKTFSKNYKGFIIFDINYLPQTKMSLESFPKKIAKDFTPTIKQKEVLIDEFKTFIDEVKNLDKNLLASDSSKKHFHPLFGWINATEWFRLIEIHMRHHLPQRKRIIDFISRHS